MKKTSVLLVALSLALLSGCGITQSRPQAPPPPTGQAQEINRSQSGTLTQIGRVTVNERGSPMDAQSAIRAQANARGASYYLILALDETIQPGIWRAEAILYR